MLPLEPNLQKARELHKNGQLDEAMKIYPREVSVVRRDDDFVYISEGVEVGERYCLTPIDQPLPGMQIRVSGSSS